MQHFEAFIWQNITTCKCCLLSAEC